MTATKIGTDLRKRKVKRERERERERKRKRENLFLKRSLKCPGECTYKQTKKCKTFAKEIGQLQTEKLGSKVKSEVKRMGS